MNESPPLTPEVKTVLWAEARDLGGLATSYAQRRLAGIPEVLDSDGNRVVKTQMGIRQGGQINTDHWLTRRTAPDGTVEYLYENYPRDAASSPAKASVLVAKWNQHESIIEAYDPYQPPGQLEETAAMRAERIRRVIDNLTNAVAFDPNTQMILRELSSREEVITPQPANWLARAVLRALGR